MSLSIIIPTHNRTQILRRCLDCIEAQTVKNLEVIVVSDGPDEKTAEMFQGLEWPFPIQYFSIPKSQQGVCRNRAVEKAQGKYVLLIGDDIFLAPDACEVHVRTHERLAGSDKRLAAVLGHTTWDPSLQITPVMKWMEKSGVQFGYPKIEQYAHGPIPQDIQHWFTYTSHISLPSKTLWKYPFREDVKLYGWEDIEWGKRLADAGVLLIYEPDAKAYHHHAYTNKEAWERSRLLGYSAVKMEQLTNKVQVVPRGLKALMHRISCVLPTKRGKHWRSFFRGMKQASRAS